MAEAEWSPRSRFTEFTTDGICVPELHRTARGQAGQDVVRETPQKLKDEEKKRRQRRRSFGITITNTRP